MEEQRTSVFSNGLIWFGAAVSIAEILTGTLIAPLGFNKGLMAILIGHIIGCILLYYAGIIGSNTKKSSMDTVKIAFGKKGSYLFSSLNVLQLVG
ncbi:MAG: cytosine permease, partial [Filifactoraceae bacterium]